MIPPGAAHPAVMEHLRSNYVHVKTLDEWQKENVRYSTEAKTAALAAVSRLDAVLARMSRLEEKQDKLILGFQKVSDRQQKQSEAFEASAGVVAGLRTSVRELSDGLGRLLRASIDNEKQDAAQDQKIQMVEKKYSTLTVLKFGAGAGTLVAVSEALKWLGRLLWAAIFGS